jgi:hypothetical protein
VALAEAALSSPSQLPLLLPRPRNVTTTGRRVPGSDPVEKRVSSIPAQGYRLVAGPDGVTIDASDADGFRHGRSTLAQLRHRSNSATPWADGDGTVPECEITDWPDHLMRGVMIDVSRDKVPTLATLEALVRRLAGWKYNHLELYMEHTFAYSGHDEVWRDADPFTAAELAHLDRFCSSLGVDLVPNQNTLGHFDRWLRHERYRPLAVAPDGFDWMFGIRRSPTTIDPAKPGSLELVSDLLAQLTSALDKPRIHIGLDEPWELSGERSMEWAGWLDRLVRLDSLEGRNLLVWGDVPAGHPELMTRIAGLADADIAICEWGYEGNHPFDDRLSMLEEAGVARWVCPGTSSWMSVTGRAIDMLENVRSAARAGEAHGASGFLVTDWGDFGHHQYLPVSELGLATAAAFSWCGSAHEDLELDDLAVLLDAHAFDDPAGGIGEALVALGSVHHLVTPQTPNMSPLVGHILFPQWPVGRGPTTGLSTSEIDAVEGALGSATRMLSTCRPARADGELVKDELRVAASWLELACRDARERLGGDGTLGSVPQASRDALGERCSELISDHRRLWLERNRPGGLDDSTAWLDHLKACYMSGQPDPSWFGPFG